ncbi:hypothetical protein LCGC14_3062580 [marine sediment metagenome]|uniref:Uncharacterized protein n=1 Tax=marine sediment metagenome TaxID=412755 RepID=A0A0F8X6Q0_9ZZZZ
MPLVIISVRTLLFVATLLSFLSDGVGMTGLNYCRDKYCPCVKTDYESKDYNTDYEVSLFWYHFNSFLIREKMISYTSRKNNARNTRYTDCTAHSGWNNREIILQL